MSAAPSTQPARQSRRLLLGSAAVGAAAILTGAWSIARRPAAEAPEWWPASLCLADAAAVTPAKIRRAQRRERGRARAAAAPADPA